MRTWKKLLSRGHSRISVSWIASFDWYSALESGTSEENIASSYNLLRNHFCVWFLDKFKNKIIR
jgi:hypothetical protein